MYLGALVIMGAPPTYETCGQNLSQCVNNTSELGCTAKFSIKQRQSTTIYSSNNGTILQVTDLRSPTPANYTAAEFFQIFDFTFYVNKSAPNFANSVNYTLSMIFDEYGAQQQSTVQECWQVESLYGAALTPYFQTIESALVQFNVAGIGADMVLSPNNTLGRTSTVAESYKRVRGSSPPANCC
jgi:hypothetical protein